jgi:hypothetical protein
MDGESLDIEDPAGSLRKLRRRPDGSFRMSWGHTLRAPLICDPQLNWTEAAARRTRRLVTSKAVGK